MSSGTVGRMEIDASSSWSAEVPTKLNGHFECRLSYQKGHLAFESFFPRPQLERNTYKKGTSADNSFLQSNISFGPPHPRNRLGGVRLTLNIGAALPVFERQQSHQRLLLLSMVDQTVVLTPWVQRDEGI